MSIRPFVKYSISCSVVFSDARTSISRSVHSVHEGLQLGRRLGEYTGSTSDKPDFKSTYVTSDESTHVLADHEITPNTMSDQHDDIYLKNSATSGDKAEFQTSRSTSWTTGTLQVTSKSTLGQSQESAGGYQHSTGSDLR